MQKVTKKWLIKFVGWKTDLLHLIYPNTCLVCQKEISKIENEICLFCTEELHFTHYEKYEEVSSLDKLFWGRMLLENTFALLFFQKGNSTQRILHEIKYKGKEELGIKMGQLIGERLLLNDKHHTIDVYIPVPLHPKKRHMRGYNQSESIANGMANKTGIPVCFDFLTRTVHAESQTKKGRFLRWDNILEAFQVSQKNYDNWKHIALVDDVITTGSTLETCAHTIRKAYPDLKISIISLAVTQ